MFRGIIGKLHGLDCLFLLSLQLNNKITTLNLQGNNLDTAGVQWICRLLAETDTIVEVVSWVNRKC